MGDHLRKRRLDLGLLQREVAERIGADKASIVNWECNATRPALHWRPRIIEFLEYAPVDPAWGPGERLRAAREAMGLSRRGLARALGVDEGTVARSELGSPRSEDRQRLRSFMASMQSLPQGRRAIASGSGKTSAPGRGGGAHRC